MPHEFKEKKLIDRISACDSLLKRNEIQPILKMLVSRDTKWIVYNNVRHRKTWSKCVYAPSTSTKLSLHPMKVVTKCDAFGGTGGE